MRDIMLMLTERVAKIFRMPHNAEYVLLSQDGKIYADIAEIKFSTKKILLCLK